MHVHEAINEISASAPIFFNSNSFETSPIGAANFFSAIRRAVKASRSIAFYNILENSQRYNFTALRMAQKNFAAPFGEVSNEFEWKNIGAEALISLITFGLCFCATQAIFLCSFNGCLGHRNYLAFMQRRDN